MSLVGTRTDNSSFYQCAVKENPSKPALRLPSNLSTPPKLSLAVAFNSSTPVRTKEKQGGQPRLESPPATCICTPARLHSCAHLLAVKCSNDIFATRLTRILDRVQNTNKLTLLHTSPLQQTKSQTSCDSLDTSLFSNP